MNEAITPDATNLKLPISVASRLDISRLIGEVERLDNGINTQAIHLQAGVNNDSQWVLSTQLSDFAMINQVDLNIAESRVNLIRTLRIMKNRVPVINFTFASPVIRQDLDKLVGWLRNSIHPQAVIGVGLQPELIGGVSIRTTNQVYDLSLRSKLAGKRHLIKEQLESLNGS